ncbi:unnamed protein product [Soboliphyme baturini]|uniref:Conserved oligomeric Golgi complex subunit 1 n=1 Tax=Soboliphyme baturini TaxID=241478 RepID=A0A183IN39_9BILA|nr:unnamed protein product [Soboliphyme baturini]
MTSADADVAFRKFSVGEIHDIENKVKIDIEEKRKDLRQVVWKRYRDIIEAADCIKEIELTCQSCSQSVRNVVDDIQRLQDILKNASWISDEDSENNERLCSQTTDIELTVDRLCTSVLMENLSSEEVLQSFISTFSSFLHHLSSQDEDSSCQKSICELTRTVHAVLFDVAQIFAVSDQDSLNTLQRRVKSMLSEPRLPGMRNY